MLRKIISALLSLSIVLSFAACKKVPSAANVSTVQKFEPSSHRPEKPTPPETVPFEETILVDNEVCTFKVTGIDADNRWGYTLKAYLENKTNLDLMFALDMVSVNGFMCDPFWASTVTAGMKANEEIGFSSSDFMRNGITDVTEIEFTLKVYDSENWSADHLIHDTYVLYPMGEEAVVSYTRTPIDREIMLFDNENCTMILTGFDSDSMWGYTVNVYLENKTDKELMFSLGDAAVNGFMCDPFWADSVAPGKRSNTSISWNSDDFESNGITSVETLTLPIRVYDNNNWSASDFVNETFSVAP